MSKVWETQLTPQEVHVYKQLFQVASKTKPNVVTGIEAVQFFAKSGLPNAILSEVSPYSKQTDRYSSFARFGRQQTKKISAILLKTRLLLRLNLLHVLRTVFKQLNHCFLQVKKKKMFHKGSLFFLLIKHTVTPLPKINGVQLTSSTITSAEKKKYQTIYNAQNPTANGIPADTARQLFAKSRLPQDQLAQVW